MFLSHVWLFRKAREYRKFYELKLYVIVTPQPNDWFTMKRPGGETWDCSILVGRGSGGETLKGFSPHTPFLGFGWSPILG